MNDIEQLQAAILRQIPEAHTKIREPRDPMGSWFLDVRLVEKFIPIEWRASIKQFGVSTSDDHGYGEGPDEVFSDIETTAQRVIGILCG